MTMVMGGETEYAISATDSCGRQVPQGTLLIDIARHAKAFPRSGLFSSRGRFCENGGLIYLDAGLHIEAATPEVTSPFEAARYLEAGDRIVLNEIEAMQSAPSPYREVFCSRVNVDYLSKTMWAAHESFNACRPTAGLADQFMPLLASRVIFGAGGWDHRSPVLRFTLSPRAHFITHETHSDSQNVRPLFHTKDESLSGANGHRLHVACAERTCSERATVLKFGTTALVLAIVELGALPGDAVQLSSPVAAVDRFARLSGASVLLARGCSVTALEIQRHYLHEVEDRLDQLPMPWAREVCALWRETLDDLERSSALADRTLDWAIKRTVFARRLAQLGIEWADLSWWDRVFARLTRRFQHRHADTRDFTMNDVLEPTFWMKGEMDAVAPILEHRGLSWADLPALIAARAEMFELDAKFGGLGDDGIFNQLEKAGVLNHRVREDRVADAVSQPPSDTRAKLRGDAVRRFTAARTPFEAEWTRVVDLSTLRQMDLIDPLQTREVWE